MSIGEAAALLGLDRNNMRVIPIDGRFRMCASALHEAVAQYRSAGRDAIAVIASAGTVSSSALDALEEIASICHEIGLWLHLDGADGAPAALVEAEKFCALNLS